MSDPAQPRVAAVVVSYQAREELRLCLASLAEHAGVACEVCVVDNASTDGSPDAVRESFPGARLIDNASNLGFGAACNQAIAATRAPYVLLLNSDAELQPGALPALVARLDAEARLGAVGPRVVSADGVTELSYGEPLDLVSEWRQRRMVRALRARRPWAVRAVETSVARGGSRGWLSGACLLVRREALSSVGGFDEGFFLYEEDVDLCVRLRAAGWDLALVPEVRVRHVGGGSGAHDPTLPSRAYHRSHLHYYRKHNGTLERLVLRAWKLVQASAGWITALGPGAGRRARRAEAVWLARLALGHDV